LEIAINNRPQIEQTVTISVAQRQTKKTVSLDHALSQVRLSLQQRDILQAEFISRQIIEECPKTTQAYDALFHILFHAGRYQELETLCALWTHHCPKFVPAYLNLSTALRFQQKHKKATQCLNSALSIEPDNVHVLNQLATLYREHGEFEYALTKYNRVIEIDPKFCAAYWNRAELYRDISEAELIEIEAIASAPQLPAIEKAYAYYAIALGYEFKKNYRKSFTYFQRGAQFKRSILKSDHAAEILAMERISETFKPDIFSSPNYSNESTAPIFICGLPRSGTTLIEHIISSHSAVSAGDELYELARATENHLLKNKITTTYPDWVPDVTDESWLAIGQDYLNLTKHLQNTPYFTDKMPLNYKALGIVRLALPNAKIINCMRHPLDNIFGCFKQLFGDGLQFTYDLDELTDTYIAYRKTMHHWHELFPGEILDVQYEELVNDQEGQTKRILDFLGLDWSEDCMNFHRNSRVVHTTSNSQIRQPLFSSSIGRWRNYEHELAPLKERLKNYL
jgi:tetratricopeptide (TPR) repeat protein